MSAASALKMSYAGITKGTQAIGAAMMLAAMRAGSAEALFEELAIQPEGNAGLVQAQLPMMPREGLSMGRGNAGDRRLRRRGPCRARALRRRRAFLRAHRRGFCRRQEGHGRAQGVFGKGSERCLTLERGVLKLFTPASPRRARCDRRAPSKSATWTSFDSESRTETDCALRLAKTSPSRRASAGRKPFERLVEQQHAPAGHERARQRHHLLLAAGEFERAPVANARHLRHDGENPVEPLARRRKALRPSSAAGCSVRP